MEFSLRRFPMQRVAPENVVCLCDGSPQSHISTCIVFFVGVFIKNFLIATGRQYEYDALPGADTKKPAGAG